MTADKNMTELYVDKSTVNIYKAALAMYEALDGLMELQQIEHGAVVVRACPSSASILRAQQALAEAEGK